MHQFFAIDQIREDKKLRLVSMHLFGKALHWHLQFVKRHGENIPLAMYESEIISRFGDVTDDPLVELKNLEKTGDVQTYQDKFEVLLNRVDLTEEQAVSLFVGGLKGEIGIPLRMFKPATMKDVNALARQHEASVAVMKTKPHYSPFTGTRYQSNSNVTTRP